MGFDIDNTIEGLKWFVQNRVPRDVDWADEDPWVVDAIRGSILETKCRDGLTKYLVSGDLVKEMADNAIRRLDAIEEYPEWPDIKPRLCDDYPLGIGTYGWKYNHDIIHRALESIQLIDTAEGYGYGKVELELGQVLNERTGDEYIASKVSRNHLAYQSVLNAAHRTADRLGSNRIELYQVHWPNPKYPIDKTMAAMRRLMTDDDVEVWEVGVCNVCVDQIAAAQNALSPASLTAIQVRYNLMDRGIERALLPYCREAGLTIIAYSPLGQKFKDMSAHAPGAPVLLDVAQRNGISPAQAAIVWLMSKDGVIPIPRTNNMDHLEEILECVDITLPESAIDELEAAFPITE